MGVGSSLLYAFDSENVGVQIHGQYKVIDLLDGKLTVGGKADLSTIFNDFEDVSEFYFGVSPRAEYHFTDFFSIHVDTGINLVLISTNYNGERNTNTNPSVGFGGHLNLTDNISLNVEGRQY